MVANVLILLSFVALLLPGVANKWALGLVESARVGKLVVENMADFIPRPDLCDRVCSGAGLTGHLPPPSATLWLANCAILGASYCVSARFMIGANGPISMFWVTHLRLEEHRAIELLILFDSS